MQSTRRVASIAMEHAAYELARQDIETVKDSGCLSLWLEGREWLTEVPYTIGDVKGLKNLMLKQNKRLRCIPNTLTGLRLTRVDLTQCCLGEVPSVLCGLKYIEELYLGGNELRSLPESLAQLRSLRTLSLEDNRITLFTEALHPLVTSLTYLNLLNNPLLRPSDPAPSLPHSTPDTCRCTEPLPPKPFSCFSFEKTAEQTIPTILPESLVYIPFLYALCSTDCLISFSKGQYIKAFQ